MTGRWPRTVRPALLAVSAVVVVAIGSVGVAHATPTSDDTVLDFPGDFRAPFECELETTYATYTGHDANALDFIRADGGQDTGTPILASADGTAHLSEGPGAGLAVNIDHEGGWQTRNYHLDTRTVQDGEQVEQGQQVGTMGETGNVTGPHLHYEQRLNGVAQEIELEGEALAPYPFDYGEGFVTSTNGCDGDGPGEPDKEATSLSYTGPDAVANGEPAELSATLTDGDGGPVADRTVDFALGTGADEQTCEGTTDTDGAAACAIDEVDQPVSDDGTVPVTVSFAGDDGYESSTASDDLRITLETELEYTGVGTVANDTTAELSGTLTDETGAAVSDQTVGFTLGSGDAAQTCEGTTDAEGGAACSIDAVDQDLDDDGTVPVTLAFEGDGYYEASEASAEVLLEHVSGSAFGLSADVPLLGLPISLGPVPETGEVRTERAGTVAPDCAQSVGSLLVSADVLCAEVESVTAPTGVTSSASVSEASIGIAGIPAIGVSGLEVSSTSTCDEQSGSVDLTLTVAGTPIEVGDAPNVEVDLSGLAGTRLVVNEQIEEEDGSLTVNGVHLTGPGGIDVVVGSAESAAHNCA